MQSNKTACFDSEFRTPPLFFFNMYISSLAIFSAWEKLQNYIKEWNIFP